METEGSYSVELDRKRTIDKIGATGKDPKNLAGKSEKPKRFRTIIVKFKTFVAVGNRGINKKVERSRGVREGSCEIRVATEFEEL